MRIGTQMSMGKSTSNGCNDDEFVVGLKSECGSDLIIGHNVEIAFGTRKTWCCYAQILVKR